MPIYNIIDYIQAKFNLKTVARHTLALVFENSLHDRVQHSIQPQRMGTKIDIEKSRKDSEMEKNQPSFFKNKQSDIFFACCGVLYILLHLSIPVIIIVNSISKEKAMPAIVSHHYTNNHF